MNTRRYPTKKYHRKRRKVQPRGQKDSPGFRPRASRQLKPLLAEIGVAPAARIQAPDGVLACVRTDGRRKIVPFPDSPDWFPDRSESTDCS